MSIDINKSVLPGTLSTPGGRGQGEGGGTNGLLSERVHKAVNTAPVVDLHTHLFAPQFGSLNLWGIDELLTYHYLVAETLRTEPTVTPEAFFARDKAVQADLVWESLFVRRSPLSEATTGVLTVLDAFGLDPHAKDLVEARDFYASRTVDEHLEEVLKLAGVEALAMTNDPLDPVERQAWDAGIGPDPRFMAALRIDPIVNGWGETMERLLAEGYVVERGINGQTIREVRRFLDLWIERMKPRYIAVSLLEAPDPLQESESARLLKKAVLPACREHDLPLAMMIGVRRAVNPRLGPAGDSVRTADLSILERFAAKFPNNRFLVTTLARENAHGLCVVARKFANVLPFGCWWFMNNPSLVEETTLMRLEMLGPTFVPQHSDARILDQLVYKWRHARRSIANALTRRYEAMVVPPTDAQIERDAKDMVGGIAREWLRG